MRRRIFDFSTAEGPADAQRKKMSESIEFLFSRNVDNGDETFFLILGPRRPNERKYGFLTQAIMFKKV